jgi:hypothetical protein
MSRLSQIKGAANMEPRFSRSRATSSAFEAQLSKAADEREILNEGAASSSLRPRKKNVEVCTRDSA